jgi:hypothetical protein
MLRSLPVAQVNVQVVWQISHPGLQACFERFEVGDQVLGASFLPTLTVHPVEDVMEDDAQFAELLESGDTVAGGTWIACAAGVGEWMPVFKLLECVHESDGHLAWQCSETCWAALVQRLHLVHHKCRPIYYRKYVSVEHAMACHEFGPARLTSATNLQVFLRESMHIWE